MEELQCLDSKEEVGHLSTEERSIKINLRASLATLLIESSEVKLILKKE